jgi:hypothetical protein
MTDLNPPTRRELLSVIGKAVIAWYMAIASSPARHS